MNKYQETLDFVKSLHSNDNQQETNFRVLEDIVQELIEKANKYDKKEIKAYEVLEKLVERDTPMIPIFESIELICPKCREGQHTNTAKFCSECGQKLDWSE